MLILFGRHGVRELLSISGLIRYSTSSADTVVVGGITPNSQIHFMVDYLIDSLGFSKDEAISASSKVSHLKSVKNSELVINLFKQYGLDKPQIRDIVSSAPQILLHKGYKTIEPKIRVLRDLGLSGSDLANLVKKNPNFFGLGVNTKIIPTIEYLRKILGSDENVVKTINKSSWLFSGNALKRISANVLLLQNYGLSNEKIQSFVLKHPIQVKENPAWLQGKLHWVEQVLGIPRNSPAFFYGIRTVSFSHSAIEKRFQLFRSFGWSDSDVYAMARTQPLCLTISEAKIRAGMNFFIKELGYTPAYLATCPFLLALSLDKRVKPRYQVLKILKEKKPLNSKLPALVTLASYPELKFLKFIQRFENEIPNLYEMYTNSMK